MLTNSFFRPDEIHYRYLVTYPKVTDWPGGVEQAESIPTTVFS